MATTSRKRCLSACSTSFSDEEEQRAGLCLCGPDAAAPPEQQHPYDAMLCCHRLHDSLLSSDSRFTAYRGILNWIIILLVLTHAHLCLENFIQHGFLIDLKKVLEHLTENNYNWPGELSSTLIHRLHLANLGLLMMVSALAILLHPAISTGGAFFTLWSYTVLGLKLYSYQETNRWYRQGNEFNTFSLHFYGALLTPHRLFDNLHLSTVTEEEKTEPHLPRTVDEHLTFKDLYYFLMAPTLCYQRDFPRSPKIRISKLLLRLLEMWIEPIFQRSENSFSNMDFTIRVEHLVGLVAPTHFLWLLLFFLCHSYLNLCAEVLRFGDRHFYGDWWSVSLSFLSKLKCHVYRNAPSLITLWRNWNIPFQKWCHRHMYIRLVEGKLCPWQAELLVFLFSAVLCEYVIALPLHSCRMWIFLMMVFELLVTVCLGRYFQGNYGNGLVWLCLLLGPPLAVTMYFHDHYIGLHRHHQQLLSPSSSPQSAQY
ncbi:Diacylglycerol O-acyltransferase 1 [Merluccius polli]|uniref:O-acyltransferase n=1 Tax=Merluccius polli TaxID=89951 RepID=A0AA47NBX6_MERPO|nr:Diacylglycerol O-acyltransferase 1 [Merluccius polli]